MKKYRIINTTADKLKLQYMRLNQTKHLPKSDPTTITVTLSGYSKITRKIVFQ